MKNTEVTDDKASVQSDDVKALKEKIRQLEKEMKHEKLRADVYDEFINVAEENFKIQIRKKSWRKTVDRLHAADPKAYAVGADVQTVWREQAGVLQI